MIAVEHVKIGNSVEEKDEFVSLNGIFNTIVDSDIIDGKINCFIITSINASSDEIGKKKRLVSQIVTVQDGKSRVLEFNNEEYEIKTPKTAVSFHMNPLPLLGDGVYFYRFIERGDTDNILYYSPLFQVVPAKCEAEPNNIFAQPTCLNK